LAVLCGVSPAGIFENQPSPAEAATGMANNALWTILVRMRSDARTREYVASAPVRGPVEKEIFRCLKRYIVREIH
jgi:hypothetical protein